MPAHIHTKHDNGCSGNLVTVARASDRAAAVLDSCFNGVTAAGCVRDGDRRRESRGRRPEFRWVNTILGNIKNALCGTYHAVRPKYAQRYLAEFEYRFNRRFDLPDIIPRLVYVALRTPPMPERLLKLRLA